MAARAAEDVLRTVGLSAVDAAAFLPAAAERAAGVLGSRRPQPREAQRNDTKAALSATARALFQHAGALQHTRRSGRA